ncbi:sigma-70 family RNA polymerase sigma factor [Streptomyces sp. LP11]|uniref:Sigma-70 family RNA polymerase sigma factor n=1 Tax=Streptomyces pyxinicus TaxID=2970331 RepID=A0ABT2B5C8_9ACTN|nr:sigma-70 family RNA polymerase sigma factor [Streptomyces sp. LP11]MCS0603733.1 sigma-70 family RNA polymerase sigma factor [Streptomyces sp. LP11]
MLPPLDDFHRHHAALPRARSGRLALTFEAFHDYHRKLWMRFAHIQVGSRSSAEAVVDAACVRLKKTWPHALLQESVPQYAWQVLKEEVHRWLAERRLEPQVGDAAYLTAVQKLLMHEMRDELRVISQEIGLYAAISALPERQYDVILLRFLLGMGEAEVAEYLGIDGATVRSHIRHARRSLAKQLHIPYKDDKEGEN